MPLPNLQCRVLDKPTANRIVIEKHYMHRRPQNSFSYGLYSGEALLGVLIVGLPANRSAQKAACKTAPNCVLELNRLWVCDSLGKNAESFFIGTALRMLPPRIIISYADTSEGHMGYVYRASNWNYWGYTDMERKTPRFSYEISGGRHSRGSHRNGTTEFIKKIPRTVKLRYWTATGTPVERRSLRALCTLPTLDWASALNIPDFMR